MVTLFSSGLPKCPPKRLQPRLCNKACLMPGLWWQFSHTDTDSVFTIRVKNSADKVIKTSRPLTSKEIQVRFKCNSNPSNPQPSSHQFFWSVVTHTESKGLPLTSLSLTDWCQVTLPSEQLNRKKYQIKSRARGLLPGLLLKNSSPIDETMSLNPTISGNLHPKGWTHNPCRRGFGFRCHFRLFFYAVVHQRRSEKSSSFCHLCLITWVNGSIQVKGSLVSV
ncbi:hypothetical protein CEXT_268521 [Caerostris extrusa]|uniref:Uncharacterized protein n=1 Tax=Caerostris extrusa TaxID=172846 RepID=A0AAV4VF79_CAEEX|nr:hypothetical protein CEXT_268521 [Caerostris extrusa]